MGFEYHGSRPNHRGGVFTREFTATKGVTSLIFVLNPIVALGLDPPLPYGDSTHGQEPA